MQTDANLVLYHQYGTNCGVGSATGCTPIWQAGTTGHAGAFATLNGDGNFVVYDPNNNPLWYSHSSGQIRSYELVCQTDGNLVIYPLPFDGSFVWQTATTGK